jgi:hypothetical protein
LLVWVQYLTVVGVCFSLSVCVFFVCLAFSWLFFGSYVYLSFVF